MKEQIEKARKALEVLIMYATEDREDYEIDATYDAYDVIKEALDAMEKREAQNVTEQQRSENH